MLPLCDVLVVAAAKNAQTIGSIGRRELQLLRPGARVIIASRGGIVDEQALAEALHSGAIAGAAVDTFASEPPPTSNPLFDAPNLIATPHVAGSFKDYWPMVCTILCENLKRLRAGQSPVNLASRD
jgi:phosphoglycerate dehydrogenase-like enzyme